MATGGVKNVNPRKSDLNYWTQNHVKIKMKIIGGGLISPENHET